VNEPPLLGPHLVIAGTARGGTSALAAALNAHPAIELGSSKESNYFSRNYERGPAWYNGLFPKRSEGYLRLDASTSYTSPQYPDALRRLRASSPSAFGVYVARDPIERAVSHYLMRRYTLQLDDAPTFGESLRTGANYAEVGDYARWLPALKATFCDERLLVAPFQAITHSIYEVASVICSRLDLDSPPIADETARSHRNHVVSYHKGTRGAIRVLRRNALYPTLRSAIGSKRIRSIRNHVVSPVPLPTLEEALASCDKRQRIELDRLKDRAIGAVREHLVHQDEREGLNWAHYWGQQ